MYGLRGMGSPNDQPDVFSEADMSAFLNPPTGPDAGSVAPLQVGALSQKISSSGQYSLNSSGQLQQNVVAGISNSSLLMIAGGVLAGVIFLGAMGGRRR